MHSLSFSANQLSFISNAHRHEFRKASVEFAREKGRQYNKHVSLLLFAKQLNEELVR